MSSVRSNQFRTGVLCGFVFVLGVAAGLAYTPPTLSRMEPRKLHAGGPAPAPGVDPASEPSASEGVDEPGSEPTHASGLSRSEWKRLIEAVAHIESGGNPSALNPAEDAAGILQIRPIMVRDCNRIVGSSRWSLEDRMSKVESMRMFLAYSRHYAERFGDYSLEGVARRWNGGPRGHEKRSTLPYWRSVSEALGHE